jgi:hypothetical protein
MTHVPQRSRLIVAVLVLVIATAAVSACGGSASSANGDSEPATVEPIKGTDLKRVTLSEEAAKRLGIKTAAVRPHGALGTVVPYGAVLYNADGSTFTYTSPKPLVYVRAPIRVERIDGAEAILSHGPPVGTAVVTVGSQELYGSEYEVEED